VGLLSSNSTSGRCMPTESSAHNLHQLDNCRRKIPDDGRSSPSEAVGSRQRGYPWFSSRAQGGPVRRPAQKRDTLKPTADTAPLPSTLPRSRAHGGREAPETRAHRSRRFRAAQSEASQRADAASLSSAATCSLQRPGPEALRRPPCGREGAMYAG
jgi:hypothetical protein